MGRAEKVLQRLAKEDAERERHYASRASTREARYAKIDELQTKISAEYAAHPFEFTDEARWMHRHLVDEYQFDLLFYFSRVRKGLPP
jgi:hypothetical protein